MLPKSTSRCLVGGNYKWNFTLRNPNYLFHPPVQLMTLTCTPQGQQVFLGENSLRSRSSWSVLHLVSTALLACVLAPLVRAVVFLATPLPEGLKKIPVGLFSLVSAFIIFF